MFAVLRDYFASRRRMRQYSGDFFRRGMRCDLLPAAAHAKKSTPVVDVLRWRKGWRGDGWRFLGRGGEDFLL